jgi:hypothetical protein
MAKKHNGGSPKAPPMRPGGRGTAKTMSGTKPASPKAPNVAAAVNGYTDATPVNT